MQKRLFSTPKLDLDCGETIPVTVGYETYGRLNCAADNAILICHYFSATSHAAGRYHPDDEHPGWWDALIGPGKAFDTDRYFIVSVDTLCNMNVPDPMVISAGPATINPGTGRPYGQSFPQVTIRDNVRLQRQLLDSLGVGRLACVAGPSMGGFQALEWAVTYPKAVDKVIAAISAPAAPPVFGLAACQAGIDAIQADPAFNGGDYYGTEGPVRGLTRAAMMLTTLARSDAWITGKWQRKTAVGSAHPWADREGRYAFQAEIEQIARDRAQRYDANHFIYTARAAMLHDLGMGNGGLDGAAAKIRAQVLMLPVSSDLIFPPAASQELVDAIRAHGGKAEITVIESPNGHLAGVYEAALLSDPINRFLTWHEVH